MLKQVPEDIIAALYRDFEEKKSMKIALKSFSFASGGCINHGGQLSTSEGKYFLKWNDAQRYPGMFASEARGLGLLYKTGGITVPQVLWAGQGEGGHSYLLMEYIEQAPHKNTYWEEAGRILAALHGKGQKHYGLDHDNYIGSLPQSNHWHENWLDFFVSERLYPQLKLAQERKIMNNELLKSFDLLIQCLPDLIDDGEAPALLHGDLWSGNLITDDKGCPCLIDPAVYFGHREIELAFTTLFGGFERAFYESYQEAYPLNPGFNDRKDIYNLYPLLVHANLFGASYLTQLEGVLRRFV